ncbi:glutamine--fructose-6-phosphate transaminase (isomerizing) [Paralimibaculum aggregatum]|uniref:Glutamine--fructose-6-phosphate aminotransferase [isomerizing] n=1 Tax=Paralimibaculum aggregatum TaxID=3036245 RepID=A0ABQ6LGP9_9RHOB|nr:glutamine--fructose-6-phosphate transaminase (isomerizing) [Limibaculum sp. NKW23]GMG81395.1 glutamine--fructose-6-phosphate transaminase (isomerizing) [Limibaculum sp. NKW23]
MCGIVGVLGQLEVAPRLLDALRRLEYRGYDSAGLTTLENGRPVRRRAVGKLGELVRLVAANPARGTIGIGHTRWATHGAPTVDNAHPHAAGPVHVVHNGIIENYRELRAELAGEGFACSTETDTEVVAQLAARGLARGLSPEQAVAETLSRIEGAFALAFLFENQPDLMIVARHGSPLAIGWGEDEMYVGSDALALSPMTSRITYLEEGDMAVLTRAGARILDRAGNPVSREIRSVSVESTLVDKGRHRHFMAKEIHEQPSAVGRVLARYIGADRSRVVSPAEAVDWSAASRVLLIGCGTASFAAHVAKYWFEQLAGIPCELDIASEFRYREAPLDGREVAIFVSQSGETADTLAALRHVAGRVAATLGIVNVTESSIAREVDTVLPILAGPEIGVASTKAFTCMLATLATTAILAGRVRRRLDAAREAALLGEMLSLPRLMAETLRLETEIAEAAAEIAPARDVLYLGRGRLFPIALEGALKLKEISYIHAEGYASGELKHGPIALIDDGVPVVVTAPSEPLFSKTVSNMQEVLARGARVVLLTDAAGAEAAGSEASIRIVLPNIGPEMAPILYSLPVQLLAYHAALARGTDVDQPRNLAKSVTVE